MTTTTLHDSTRDAAVSCLVDGTSVNLVGSKASGRSQIVANVTELLEAEGWTVHRVAAVAALRSRPLEPLAIAGLVGAPGRGSAVAGAVEAVVAAVADGRTVVVVDDADDLDPVSTGALAAAYAVRRFPVLCVTRPGRRAGAAEDGAPVLADEVRPCVDLPVPPLRYVDVHTLLLELLGSQVDATVVGRVYASSGGLPGLVHAIAATSRRAGHLAERDGVWHADADLWTPQLVRAVTPLLSDLTPPALRSLEELALVGPVEPATARRLVPWEDLEQLEASGRLYLRTMAGEPRLSVYPPLVGEYFRHVSTGVRRLHTLERVSGALEGSDGLDLPQPEGPAGPDDPASPHLPRESGAVLGRLVHEQWTAEVLARRHAWTRAATPRTAASFLAVLLSGPVDRATAWHVLGSTPRTGDDHGLARLTEREAELVAFVDRDPDAAMRLLADAREQVGGWSGLLDAVRARVALASGRQVPDVAENLGSDVPEVAAVTRTVQAARLTTTGRTRQALELLRAFPEERGRDRDVVHGVALVCDGALEEGLEWARRHLDEARAALAPDALLGHGYVVSLALMLRGSWGELREHLGELLAVGQTPVRQQQYQVGNLALAASIAHLDGRPSAAAALVAQARAFGLPPGPFPYMSTVWARTSAALMRGGRDPELAELLWRESRALRDRDCLVSGVLAGIPSLELRPDPARAAELAEAAAGAEGTLVPLLVEHGLALGDGDPEAMHRVAGRLDDAGLLLHSVRLRAAAVRVLRERGDMSAATEALARARRLVARRPDLLAFLAPLAPGVNLTPREREVARLAARGLANAEIADELVLSVRTVENHLASAFRKSGVGTRAQLAELLDDDAPRPARLV
ncbi:LuxR C-terminal-related transcriptional regulator [Isoptericola sp. NPDC019693]|uniref:helix-turn-helix transcriptional regulator n=1 Tax=Isoptericola sp. NPDC019693 TaxID=3364009 RepID=UPI0037A949F1